MSAETQAYVFLARKVRYQPRSWCKIPTLVSTQMSGWRDHKSECIYIFVLKLRRSLREFRCRLCASSEPQKHHFFSETSTFPTFGCNHTDVALDHGGFSIECAGLLTTLTLATRSMPTKGPRWKAEASARCAEQFDLFVSSNGDEGWDPDETDGNAIVDLVKEDLVIKPYMSKKLGGDKNHRDNEKAIRGYQRAASEFFVADALQGRRRNDHSKQKTKSKSALSLSDVVNFFFHPIFLTVFSLWLFSFFNADSWREDAEAQEESPTTPMPAKKKSTGTPAKGKKTPSSATKNKTTEATTAEDIDDSEVVDNLASKIDQSLLIKHYFRRYRKKGFPCCVWAWSDEEGVTFLTIRVQLLGTTIGADCSAEFEEEGRSLKIRIVFPDGGEDTNPEHLLLLNGDYDPDYSRSHPQYTSLQAGRRVYSEAAESPDDEDVVMSIPLPFQCNPQGFVNPFTNDPNEQNKISVGIFPLTDRKKYPPVAGAPPPSVKFLHINCVELHKPKQKQQVQEKSYFGDAMAT